MLHAVKCFVQIAMEEVDKEVSYFDIADFIDAGVYFIRFDWKRLVKHNREGRTVYWGDIACEVYDTLFLL